MSAPEAFVGSEAAERALAAARQLLALPTAPGWQRGVALLTRQAIEAYVDSIWASREPAMVAVSWRAKLIALPACVADEHARSLSYWWSTLSNACHLHPYELAPAATELTSWVFEVGALINDSAGSP